MVRQALFRIEHSSRRGRHLIATADIAAGSVLSSELPIARALATDQLCRRCHHCWRLLEETQRCSSCQFAYYCSVNCQRLAWSQHRVTCQMIQQICHSRCVQPTPSLLLLFQIVLSQPSNPLSGMVSNWDSIPKKRKSEFMQMSVLLNEMLSSVRDFRHAHSIESLAELFARHHSNSFTITDGELQPIGIGVFPCPVTLLNHSCRPNAIIVFEPSTSRAFVKASRSINRNEEINISYCDLLRECSVRRLELLDQYCFICSCLSCKGSEEVAVIQTTSKLQSRFLTLLDDEDYEAAEETLSLIPAETAYQFNPVQLGIHYFKLGKLRVFLCRSSAQECLNRARQLLGQYLTATDPALSELDRLCYEASSLAS